MPLPASKSLAIDADDRRDHDPFQVEAEDRPPGRVALEDHLLPGAEVEAHGASIRALAAVARAASAASPSPYLAPDGDRQGRAADHRPRPARALRLPPAGGDGGPRGGQRRPRALRARAHARRRGRAGRDLRAAARSGSPSRSRRSRRARRRSWSGSASGSPASTARPPRAACSWCCRRDRCGGRACAESSCGRDPPPARRRWRRRAARGQAAGGAGGAGAARCRRRAGRAVGADRDAAPARGARPDRDPQLELRRAPAPRRAAGERPSCCPSRRRSRDRRRARRRGRVPRELLLHGVTGSGKTEVYLAAVEAALARGRGAIVLVPEIGLAPQAVARFRARLGDRFAVLHSALSAGERYDEWRRLRSGEASVCVGPRSAVFAPVARPRPDRDRRGARPLLQAGGRPLLRRPRRRPPPRRATAARCSSPAPRRRARSPGWSCRGWSCRAGSTAARCRRSRWSTCARPTRARGRCTPTPGRRWRACARAGAKAIVMINRRGFAPWLTCRSCGHHWGCPNCDVSLIVHRHSGRLVCHHCAHAEPLPQRLPASAPRRRSRGPAPAPSGSRRCWRERLAPMPVFRLDSDTAAGRGAHARILAALRRGRRAASSSAPRWSPRATTSPR